MNFKIIFLTALRALIRHPLRSLLTTLGIIIGIVAIITVTSIGQGAKVQVQKQIDKLGTNFVIVLGGQTRLFAQRRGGGAQLTLKDSDFKAIMDECDGINEASPGVMYRTRLIYEGTNWMTSVAGAYPNYLDIRNWSLTQGEFFSPEDLRSGNKVVVLGQTVKRELFGSSDPIGKTIRIRNSPYTIIGILAEKGKRPDGTDDDDIVLAPFTCVQRKLIGTRKFSVILISTKTKEDIAIVSKQTRSLLRHHHNLAADEEDDFTILSQDDIAQASEAASSILNLLLLIIASISLMVGGIGIMNIMLVTVTERKKEIGIRIALGATTFEVRQQFILEAITICLLGGLVGIILGVTCSKVIGLVSGWPIAIPLSSVFISMLACTLVGLFFGYYPAHKASQLNPIEALMER